MRSLIRLQLRAALTVAAPVVLSIGALPVLLLNVGGLNELTVWNIPLPWIILGVLVYPALFGLGWLYIRQVERAERDFTQLVGPDRHDPL